MLSVYRRSLLWRTGENKRNKTLPAGIGVTLNGGVDLWKGNRDGGSAWRPADRAVSMVDQLSERGWREKKKGAKISVVTLRHSRYQQARAAGVRV